MPTKLQSTQVLAEERIPISRLSVIAKRRPASSATCGPTQFSFAVFFPQNMQICFYSKDLEHMRLSFFHFSFYHHLRALKICEKYLLQVSFSLKFMNGKHSLFWVNYIVGADYKQTLSFAWCLNGWLTGHRTMKAYVSTPRKFCWHLITKRVEWKKKNQLEPTAISAGYLEGA